MVVYYTLIGMQKSVKLSILCTGEFSSYSVKLSVERVCSMLPSSSLYTIDDIGQISDLTCVCEFRTSFDCVDIGTRTD